MKTKLKQLRVNANLTQVKLAAVAGVTQPTYQRWESGAVPIPEDKIPKLAKALKTNRDAIYGRHPPIEAGFYNPSVGEALNYYGEVAIHFMGGGESLLLSISEKACEDLHQALQGDASFVTVKSLANQTVVLRTMAISDIYFSSEAYDDFGPEHDTYKFLRLQMPDARDWEIVACLEDEVGLEDFDSADVERVRAKIMITDGQFQELVADGTIAPEDIESERAEEGKESDRIFALASNMTYQLSTGKQRSCSIDEERALFFALEDLVDRAGEGTFDEEMVRIGMEGRHRIFFLNKSALDYISIPTHRFDQGRVEADAELLDEQEEGEAALH